MAKDKNRAWFPAKKYGIGWGLPVTWQGWIVLLAYLVLVAFGSAILTTLPTRIPFFIAYMLILSGILILICWKKGEKITFRWGKK